ncbi:MAG: DHA2 family efflux MFS transporter permease subunit [Paracoccaceae bacterium]
MTTAPSPWLAVLAVMLGTLSVVIETTIITVAVPEIRATYALSQTAVQWVAGGFFAAMSVTMLVSGWTAERFGLRRTYVAALCAFVLASLVGGLAPSYGVVVAARVAQGAAAGIVQPLALVVLFRAFPPERRGFGMGVYGLGVILGPAMAPALGGLLVDAYSWRAVFLVAAPFCLASILAALAFLKIEVASERPRPFDALGLALLAGALPVFLWGLANAQARGWGDPAILAALGGGAGLAALFVRRQLASPAPMVDLGVHRVPGFGAALALAFVLGAGLFGTTYLLPLYAQDIHAMTAAESGLLLMPAGLAMAGIFPLAGHLADRVRVELPILAGLAALAVSTAMIAGAERATPFLVLVAWTLVGRLGLGLMMPSINTGGLRQLPADLVTHGSSAISFARQLGGTFGVNLLAVVLERRTAVRAETLGHEEAYRLAFHDAFMALAAVVALAAVPALAMGRADRRRAATPAAR